MPEPKIAEPLPSLNESDQARVQSLEEFLFADSSLHAETMPQLEGVPTPKLSGRSDVPTTLTVPGYEILERIGRGGMGVVFKARHLGLDRPVALKLNLSGAFAGDMERARFQAEARLAASLSHPNVVQIYEIGEYEGRPFLALEYVDGCSLDRRLAGQPQPPRASAALVATLARAIHAAHERGIVHRDLKPGNVLLMRDGTPKITDFGLAKRLDAAADMTASGAVMGTPSYMAPEQAQGNARLACPATDVYALGTILYEMLTGRPPFKAATLTDTLLQVASAPPVPPRQVRPQLPVDLQTICLKCLEKQPERRYASAVALADDLARYLRGQRILARPPSLFVGAGRWCRAHRRSIALIGCLLMMGGLCAYFAPRALSPAAGATSIAGSEVSTSTGAAPPSPADLTLAAELVAEAEGQYKQTQYAKVIATCTRALAANPKSVEALFLRACSYRNLREPELAFADLNEALALAPGHADALAWRGDACNHLQRFDQAIADATEALQRNAKNRDWVYFIRAWAHAAQSNFEAALADYDAGLALNPKQAVYVYLRGLVHAQLGHVAEAKLDCDLAIQMDAKYATSTLTLPKGK